MSSTTLVVRVETSGNRSCCNSETNWCNMSMSQYVAVGQPANNAPWVATGVARCPPRQMVRVCWLCRRTTSSICTSRGLCAPAALSTSPKSTWRLTCS
eukprot:6465753-Amphidinium_carterae.1